METTGSERSDDGSTQKTEKIKKWAERPGYKLGINKPARPKLGDVFAKIGQIPPSRPTQPNPIDARAQKLNVDWTTMNLKKGLKGDDAKKTCLVDFAGTTMVLKGAEGTPTDHVVASELLGKMKLRGVNVPATRVLNDQEKADVIQMLSNGNLDAKQLASALAQGTGQLSELAEGLPMDRVFPSGRQLQAAQTGIDLRERMMDASPDDAWNAVMQAINDHSTESMTKATPEEKAKRSLFGRFPELVGWATATDSKSRKEAIEFLKDKLGNPIPLMMVEVLAEIDANTMADGLVKAKDEAKTRAAAQEKLKAWAKSTAGVESFANVAVGDLLTGMDDRILSKWNGGNFLYNPDKGELCCIDNMKNPDLGLLANDQSGWANFFMANAKSTGRIEDSIYSLIYGRNDANDDAPGNYVEFDEQQAAEAKNKIRHVLEETVRKISGDQSIGPTATARVEFLKSRLILDDMFSVPADLAVPPDTAPKLGKSEKAERAFKSRFTANSEDKRNDTQKIKDDLRKGKITAEAAKQQLDALGVDDDRRATKIRFLVAATLFCDFLDVRAAELKAFLQKTPPPPELWSDTVAAQLSAPLRELFQAWTTKAAKEDKILAKLKAAWSTFPSVVRNG